MSVSRQSARESLGIAASVDAAAVREQLRRLLAHPLFTNSKRYPVLLAYTVEQALQGHAGDLKERTIGVEAFGREPNYDVNLDPVVRTTAAEVRKRLIQYYYQAEHAGEVVIEMPVGSYVPQFRLPTPEKLSSVVPVEPPVTPQAAEPRLPPVAPAAGLRPGHVLLGLVGLAVAALLGFAAGRVPPRRPPSALERFWAPMTSAPSEVTYCLGEPVDAEDRDRNTTEGLPVYGNLNVSDVITLARTIIPLVPRNGAFRVVAATHTQFAQLRDGPVVLIGAFDNPWTLRITQNLPYGFVVEDGLRKLVDHRSPEHRFWTLQWEVPETRLAEDYAVVARIHDTVTGQPVVIVAGILGEGTEAASEVVSNPAYLEAMLQQAGPNWEQRNLEAVLETHVIDGHAGPPRVLAVQTW
ncbi:MAG: hypothetical protein KGK08_06360 [Acidobacteriota bacterium]|nr:hypothetical protein [Acidobacteriota bacterium]